MGPRLAGLQSTHDPLHLKASAAFVDRPAHGRCCFDKNEDAVLPIASVTKLMTALVLMEAKLPMDEIITITEDDVDHERHSRSRLRVGTALTRGEALHLALMSSENRAAHALGRTFPGGLRTFVESDESQGTRAGYEEHRLRRPDRAFHPQPVHRTRPGCVVSAASKEPLIREFSTTVEHDAMLGKRKVRFNNSDRLVKSHAGTSTCRRPATSSKRASAWW